MVIKIKLYVVTRVIQYTTLCYYNTSSSTAVSTVSGTKFSDQGALPRLLAVVCCRVLHVRNYLVLHMQQYFLKERVRAARLRRDLRFRRSTAIRFFKSVHVWC